MEEPICVDGNGELENDLKMDCKYCKIKKVFSDSPVLQHLSHERGCKSNPKFDLKPTLNNLNEEQNCHIGESTFSHKKQLEQHIEEFIKEKSRFNVKFVRNVFNKKLD
jgi:hypothetical protein